MHFPCFLWSSGAETEGSCRGGVKPVYSVCIPLPIYILLLWYIIHVQDAQIKKCICRRFCIKDKNRKQMYVKKIGSRRTERKIPCKLQRPKCIQNFADFRLSNACLHSKTSARQPSQHGDCYAVRPPNQPVNGPTFLTYRYASPVSTNERAPCQKTAVWGMTHA